MSTSQSAQQVSYPTWQKGHCRCDSVKDLEMGGAPGLSRLTRDYKGRDRVRGGDVRTKAEVKVRQGHQARATGHLQTLGKASKCVAPSLQEQCQHGISHASPPSSKRRHLRCFRPSLSNPRPGRAVKAAPHKLVHFLKA